MLPPSKIRGFRVKDFTQSRGVILRELERGQFGHVPHYWCDHCGSVPTPITVCIERPSRWEPGEYDWRCPYCNRFSVNENDWGVSPAKAIKRFHLILSLEQS